MRNDSSLAHKLSSRFNMMTIYEISLNSPKFFPSFCVIFWLFRSKLFFIVMRFSAEILSLYDGFPSQSGFLEFVVSSWQFCWTICHMKCKFYIFWVIGTSFAFSLLGYSSDASNFSKSSISAVRTSCSSNSTREQSMSWKDSPHLQSFFSFPGCQEALVIAQKAKAFHRIRPPLIIRSRLQWYA